MSKAITARKMFPVKISKLIPGVFLAFVMLFAGAGVQAQTLPAGTRIQDAAPQANSSTAQLVETSVGRFYQKDALSWAKLESNGFDERPLIFLERGSNGTITLQDATTLDQYTLDFSQSRVFLLKAKTYRGVDIGQITKAMPASGPGLNGVSVLLRKSDRIIHMDADRYFAPAGQTAETAMSSDGTPGQWGRFFYSRFGTSVVPTTGKNVHRVDLSNGDRFVNNSARVWFELNSQQFSWTNEWLRLPAAQYSETERDEWSVYLRNTKFPFNSVQIDLYTKKVTWSKGKPDERSQSILDEKFPSYGQFILFAGDLIDDKVFKNFFTSNSAAIKTATSSVLIDLSKNTCEGDKGEYLSCQVLLGEFTPRGITGFALGGFTLGGKRLEKTNKTVAFDQGTRGYIWTYSFNPEKFDVPQLAFFKARDRVIFGGKDPITLSLSDSSMKPLLYFNTMQTVTSTQQYFAGQMQGFLPNPDPKLSPGFQIQNRTDHAVLVTLEQVGCLYYGIVKPGETFYRQTGAVWFTVKAVIAPDLKPPTDLSCALNPAMMVATVAAAAVTGGTAAVPMAMLTAMVQGAAYATTSYVESKGGTELEMIAAKTAVIAVGGGLTGGINGIVTMNNQMVPNVGKALSAGGLTAIVSEWNQPAMDKMTAELTQKASLFGQYAGPDWPWKKVDRVMPIYDITGGPTVKQIQGGGVLYQYQTTPLTIKKTN